MAVPLFDTRTPLAPLRDALARRPPRSSTPAATSSGRRSRPSSASSPPTCGAEHAIGVANGTDALTIALRAMGVGPGRRRRRAVVHVLRVAPRRSRRPARDPVFCDVDPETFCVTPETVRAALTPRTKAVIAVHLFGNVAPVDEIEALGVPVLEDAAQAAGLAHRRRPPRRRARHRRHVLFFPSKNLGALRRRRRDHDRRRRARRARARCCASTARATRSRYEHVGYNSRLDELQAGAAARRSSRTSTPGPTAAAPPRAHYADAGLGELAALPVPVAGRAPAWHLYVVRHARAEALGGGARGRRASGSSATTARPLHRQPAMRPWADVELPGTNAKESLERIVEAIKRVTRTLKQSTD